MRGQRKKEPGIHRWWVLSSPRISGNLEIFKISAPLLCTSAWHADFSHAYKDACQWPHSVSMTRERRRHTALHLQELSARLSIPVKCCGTWLMQFVPLKFTKRSNADRHCQSDIVFDFTTACMSLIGSSGLSEGKKKLTNFSVRVYRLPREL